MCCKEYAMKYICLIIKLYKIIQSLFAYLNGKILEDKEKEIYVKKLIENSQVLRTLSKILIS